MLRGLFPGTRSIRIRSDEFDNPNKRQARERKANVGQRKRPDTSRAVTDNTVLSTRQHVDGTFSISDWSGYPHGVEKPPTGTNYRILSGVEYDEARKLANNANAKLRRDGVVPVGHEIHEIVPVKFGGNPTDPKNKTFIPRSVHRKEVTPWLNKLQRDINQ